MECVLYKLQNVGKSETPFKVFDGNAILACRYFAQYKPRFNKHAKIALIESIINTNKPNEILKEPFFKKRKLLD